MEPKPHATIETHPDMPWMTGKPVEGSPEQKAHTLFSQQLREGAEWAEELAAERAEPDTPA